MSIRKNIHKSHLKLLLYIFLIWNSNVVSAQDADDLQKQYPFLKTKLNLLINDGEAMKHFYQNLNQLKLDKNITVRITQIGDSHLQADLFSGKIRERMQLNFGNAGRGLIVPYHVARTNEPYTYQTSSNVIWKSKRNIALTDSMPIGVGGLTIATSEAGASIQIKIGNKPNLNYSFNKLTLFHEKGENCFDFDVKDSCGGTIAMLSALPFVGRRFHTEAILPSYENWISLTVRLRSYTQPSNTMVYGLLVENSKPGILYNTIGINGAEYRHYNKSLYFHEQQAALKPNLIILSLGTNEAFSRSFDPTIFIQQVDSMVSNLKATNPLASIMITMPGDHFRNRKYKNINLPLIRQVLIDYCLASKIAYWDLFQIMGGLGSIAKWNAYHLTSKDLLHLNRRGYELQGELLFQAIIRGLNNYESSFK